MKVERITYERLQSLARFNNIKIGITVMVEPNEDPREAYKRAKRFVEARIRLVEKNEDRRAEQVYEDDPPF